MVNQVVSPKQEYDYVLLMGALASRVETRLDYLIELIEKGLKIKKLVVLSGARPLIKGKEDKSLDKGLKTEFEMMKSFVESARKIKKFANIFIEYVNVPMKESKDGKILRPTTDDTVALWFEQYKPKPGSCLVISNQPYAERQRLVVCDLLPKNFTVDVAGNATDEKNEKDKGLLDTLARMIYQEAKVFF